MSLTLIEEMGMASQQLGTSRNICLNVVKKVDRKNYLNVHLYKGCVHFISTGILA